MTFIKKKIVVISLVLLSLGLATSLSADSLDDLMANDVDMETVENFEHAAPMRNYDLLSQEDKDIVDAFDLLTDTIKAPLWYNTKAPSGRDVLYLLPYKISALQRGGFVFNLFINVTNNMNVGANNLVNTEGINQEILPTFFQILTNSDKTLSSADVSSLLVLLKKITLQEIKLGGVIQACLTKGPFKIELNTSIHMAERNFWLTPSDRQAISSTIGTDSGVAFDESEFVRYRFGLGDTRLKLGLNTLNKPKFQIDLGFESILPTSKISYSPGFETAPTDKIEDIQTFSDNTIKTLKGVRDYLINPKLGIGHFGLGCYMEGKANIFHNLASMWARFSYDKLFSGNETRLILFKNTGSREAVRANTEKVHKVDTSQEQTDADMAALRASDTQYIDQYLYPTAFKTNINPGDIVNAILAISTDIKKMRFSVGYDFYLQRTEKIKNVLDTNVDMNQLLIDGAQASMASQHKIFAEALYLKKFKHSDMTFGLGGDLTVASKGIGRDWTAYAKLTTSF